MLFIFVYMSAKDFSKSGILTFERINFLKILASFSTRIDSHSPIADKINPKKDAIMDSSEINTKYFSGNKFTHAPNDNLPAVSSSRDF